jgi:hypothetical protein
MTSHTCDICCREIQELEIFVLRLQALSFLRMSKRDIAREVCPQCAEKLRPAIEQLCAEVSK